LNYTIRTRKIIKNDIYETSLNIKEMSDKELKAEKKYIKKQIYDKWQARWNAEQKGRTTYKFIPKIEYALKNNK
jgi:hypothetical protein